MLKKSVKKSFTFTLSEELYEPFVAFMADAGIESESQAVKDLIARALAADQFHAAQKMLLRRLEAKMVRFLHAKAAENMESIKAAVASLEDGLVISDVNAENELLAIADALRTERANRPPSYPGNKSEAA